MGSVGDYVVDIQAQVEKEGQSWKLLAYCGQLDMHSSEGIRELVIVAGSCWGELCPWEVCLTLCV